MNKEDIETKVDNLPFYKPVNKEDPKQKDTSINNEDPGASLDTIQEQLEAPMTSIHCKDSIKAEDLKKVEKNPENYIEINIIKKIRLVDSFYITSDLKKFKYKKIDYDIIEENVYILPTKSKFFMPTCFFYEDKKDPVSFAQKNKGITGKALTLLYNPKLYKDLFSGEEVQYNLFIVVLYMISISAYLIGLYHLLGGSF